jgi:hypothetical protein
MQTQFLNPPAICPTFGWTYVVTAAGGKTVYISGQVGVNERGEVIGKGDLRVQTEQTYENLKHALTAAGATFCDVLLFAVLISWFGFRLPPGCSPAPAGGHAADPPCAPPPPSGWDSTSPSAKR